MSKKRFTVILTEEQQEQLNYLAWLEEVTPSVVMRDLINIAYKNKHSKEKKALQKLQSSK